MIAIQEIHEQSLGARAVVFFFLAGMTSVSQPLVFACVRRFDSELCNLASKDACVLIRDALDNAVYILNSIKKVLKQKSVC